MSLTKRNAEVLVDEGLICPVCWAPDHDFDDCISEYEYRNSQERENGEVDS